MGEKDPMGYKKLIRTQNKNRFAFSLIEIIAVITISALIIVAVLNLYGRVQATAASINAKIDSQLLPNEVIQRIAEDIDRLTSPGLETAISVANKLDGDLNLTKLSITTNFYGSGINPKSQVFEEVIWQSEYNPVEESIVLYRLHAGLNLEDKVTERYLLDKPESERELFIPITTGITFFEITVPRGENELREWKTAAMPRAIRVTISFAQPQEDFSGEFILYDEDKMTRTIAIDRTRAIRYKFVKKEFKAEDPNDISEDTATEDEDEGESEDEGEGPSTDSPTKNDEAAEGQGPPAPREKAGPKSDKE